MNHISIYLTQSHKQRKQNFWNQYIWTHIQTHTGRRSESKIKQDRSEQKNPRN